MPAIFPSRISKSALRSRFCEGSRMVPFWMSSEGMTPIVATDVGKSSHRGFRTETAASPSLPQLHFRGRQLANLNVLQRRGGLIGGDAKRAAGQHFAAER